jgi:hypothetical protein
MKDEMGEHVECMGKFRSENLKGRDDSEDLDIDGRIILELILEKYGGKL